MDRQSLAQRLLQFFDLGLDGGFGLADLLLELVGKSNLTAYDQETQTADSNSPISLIKPIPAEGQAVKQNKIVMQAEQVLNKLAFMKDLDAEVLYADLNSLCLAVIGCPDIQPGRVQQIDSKIDLSVDDLGVSIKLAKRLNVARSLLEHVDQFGGDSSVYRDKVRKYLSEKDE